MQDENNPEEYLARFEIFKEHKKSREINVDSFVPFLNHENFSQTCRAKLLTREQIKMYY